MGCRLSDFNVGEWQTYVLGGHRVAIASASSKRFKSEFPDVLFSLDGKFQGMTGSRDAALYHAMQSIRPCPHGNEHRYCPDCEKDALENAVEVQHG